MSRYVASIEGKTIVRRQGHERLGIGASVAGRYAGVRILARADGTHDAFTVYAIPGIGEGDRGAYLGSLLAHPNGTQE